MDPTISVSKGCFVFKNGATRADKTKKSTKRKKATASKTGILGKEITDQPFYSVYAETWHRIQSHIDTLQKESSAKTMHDLVDYVVKQSKFEDHYLGLDEIVPAAALLTGINQPDHLEQFDNLAQSIKDKLSASICLLQSRSCASLKDAVENMVYNFMESPQEDDEDRDHKRLRKSHCNMRQLKRWYHNNWPSSVRRTVDDADQEDASSETDRSSVVSAVVNSDERHMLIVILPDFECFSSAILQDLIMILSSNCREVPFVLILGIATSIAAIHNALPYHVTSKIKLRVFQTQSAPVGLNEILEKVILSPKYAFHLSGKAFKFLTHIFLYYDFSITGFIQGFKYCFMEHFFQGNAYALCTNYTASLTKIKAMSHDDMEVIRKQLSFRPYVESINDCKRIIAILTDDNYLKKKLPSLLRDCHVYFMTLRIFLEFLTVLVEDLPKCPLGKLRREIYATCLSRDVCAQAEFKECWQMLAFMSKDEFVAKVSRAIKTTQDFYDHEIKGKLELAEDCEKIVMEKLQAVKELITTVVMAGMDASKSVEQTSVTSPDELKQLSSRQDLKDKLLQMSKQQKPISEFTKSVQETLDFIEKHIVAEHLGPLQKAPALHELFVFSDISTVKRNIIGAPRAALHMALNNPHFYLQCKCCGLREHSQLLATLPDISVMYKLHLECGRMINLYDWLQAFRSVVDFAEEEQEQVDPQTQARFTRAVAELQFLGYIKMSKRKTDHVTRLTW